MRKIRLFCAAGMSTSLLVTKMQKAAEELKAVCPEMRGKIMQKKLRRCRPGFLLYWKNKCPV